MAAWMLPAAIAGSSILGAFASKSAADTQAGATDRSTAAQERMFGKQVELQEPFRQVGVNALPELVAASRYTPFSIEEFQKDPGYQFRLREGLRALENRAAAEGTRISGNQLRGLVRYNQELAGQDWMNSFNRYQAERAARLNPLQSLVGAGQTTAQNIAGAAGRLGENIGANMIQGGVARASGYMGMANALSGGLSQYLAYDQNLKQNARDQQYIDLLRSKANTYFG
jgi:hypothetical protein